MGRQPKSKPLLKPLITEHDSKVIRACHIKCGPGVTWEGPASSCTEPTSGHTDRELSSGRAGQSLPATQSQPARSCTELDRKRSELASSRPEAGWRTKLAGRQSRMAAEQNQPATAQPDSGRTELAAAGKEMGWDLKRVTIQRVHNIHKNLSKAYDVGSEKQDSVTFP